MLDYSLTVLNQIFIMFLLMMIGFALAKFGVINDSGSSQISSLLMKTIMPAMIVSAFSREYDSALAMQLLQAFVLVIIVYAVPIIFARIFYKNDPDKAMCIVMSNNGFMAIPLIQALLGSVGVFIGSVHIVGANILTWTYGISLYGGKAKGKAWKMLVLNPGTIALACGLVLFLTPLYLPAPILTTVNYLAAANTPVAMILLGTYLANIKLLPCLKDKGLMILSFVKLILIPLILIGIFALIPFGSMVRCAMLIGSTAPTGMIVSMIAQYCGRDYSWNTSAVTFTTLLSIITMPLILTLMQAVLG
ncbi:MAG: AEC family transporter [Oscillospiraceae bacterium]